MNDTNNTNTVNITVNNPIITPRLSAPARFILNDVTNPDTWTQEYLHTACG